MPNTKPQNAERPPAPETPDPDVLEPDPDPVADEEEDASVVPPADAVDLPC